MKRALLGAALLCLAGLAPGKGGAETPSVASAPLTYQAFQTAQEMMELSAGGVEAELTPFAAGRGEGEGRIDRRSFQLSARWLHTPVSGAVGRPAGTVAFDRLWLDWNHNRRVDPGEHFAGSTQGTLSVFGPIRRPHSGAPPVYLIVHENTHVHLVPAGCFVGDLPLGGKRVRVAAVDANADGILGQPGVLGEEGDLLLLDVNGDGKFTGVSEDWMAHPWDLEALPMQPLVQMPDGGYYRVTVPPTGAFLSAAPDDRPLGRVRLPGDRFAMEAVSGSDRFWVRSSGGEASLPAGSYLVPWVVLGVADAQKQLWTASILPRRPRKESDRLRIDAGAATDYRCGPPFRTQISARGGGRRRNLTVTLLDTAWNPVTEVLTPQGQRPSEPEVRLVDANGRLVKAGRLKYGADFRCSGSWTVPATGGDLRPTVEWPLGPFTLAPPAGSTAASPRPGPAASR